MKFTGIRKTCLEICRPGSGARTFFTGILVWGIGMGCFNAVFHNFVVDEYHINGFDRGVLEFMREIPGVLLVVVLALLSRFSDWRVLRIGTIVSILAAGLLMFSVPWAGAVALIAFWSLGEHTVMPVRQSLSLMLAKDGKGGESLGFMTSMMNAGTVAGSLIAAAVFFFGPRLFDGIAARTLYDAVFVVVIALLGASVIFSMRKAEPGERMRRRPKFYFRRKYSKFYALELFYGARKQVFFTFGPFVLINAYGLETRHVAVLFAVSAFLTALWGGRLVGRLVDRWGYRNVMIWDTVVLAGVSFSMASRRISSRPRSPWRSFASTTSLTPSSPTVRLRRISMRGRCPIRRRSSRRRFPRVFPSTTSSRSFTRCSAAGSTIGSDPASSSRLPR